MCYWMCYWMHLSCTPTSTFLLKSTTSRVKGFKLFLKEKAKHIPLALAATKNYSNK